MLGSLPIPLLVVIVLVVMFLASAIKVLNEYERAVLFRLGRIREIKGPGLIIIIPGIDKIVRIDMRTITMDVPSQDVITKDNVSIKVSAVVYFRVMDANAAVTNVENYLYATSQLALATGIGRGLDVILILGLIGCYYLLFRIFNMMENLEEQMNYLIRELALQGGESGEKEDDED